jgi:FkbM family methyltransferase
LIHPFGFKTRLIGGHWLCVDLIPRDATVVDIGANRGVFGVALRKERNAHVYAVEPSPQMFEALPAEASSRKLNVAIADHSGHSTFYVRDNSEASSLERRQSADAAEEITVETTTLPLVLERFGLERADVLKVDAEGAELVMFRCCADEFLRKCDQICIEFHEWFGVGSKQEVEGVISSIEAAGFRSFSLVRGNYQAVLFVNRRLMSSWQHGLTWLRIWGWRGVASARRRITGI